MSVLPDMHRLLYVPNNTGENCDHFRKNLKTIQFLSFLHYIHSYVKFNISSTISIHIMIQQ